MGEGRDALFLAEQGFQVTGVESTQAGVAKCRRLAEQRSLTLRAVTADALEFKIAAARYSLVAAINLFQFMTKADAARLIEKIVRGLKRGGLLAVQTFTIDDPSYRVRKKKSREIQPGVFLDSAGNIYSLYDYGELLRLCGALRPIYYAEYDYYDTMHGTAHWHGVADFVGKKL